MAMGSPLSNIFANIFMDEFERKALASAVQTEDLVEGMHRRDKKTTKSKDKRAQRKHEKRSHRKVENCTPLLV
ncbi:hypothetical protein J6590_069345 [Homalodisca vitripennis]|nr:hypothetical protein J6590_069345 [Homalodisca vitripennis]